MKSESRTPAKQKKETLATPAKEKRAAPVTKRAVAKKPSTKAACTCRGECKPQEAFWIHHGPVVSSIAELMGALADMSDEQYAYHTKRNGNDFAAWLRDCFGNDALASRIESATSRTKAAEALRSPCCK